MKKIILLLLLGLAARASFAQQKDLTKIADSIVAEGKTLYKSEWASWYGGDVFLAKFPGKRSLMGGYLSYDTGKGLNNIILSKGDDPTVLATISFAYGFNTSNYTLDTTSRKLNRQEAELFTIRLNAVKRISTDTSFKHFNHTNLNPVPLIVNGEKKVYVLTGPDVNGVMIIGNDYLMTFNQNNEPITIRRLHKNIIPIRFNQNSKDSTKTQVASIHSHTAQTGEFITATDICTLMLYEGFTTWNQHIVVGQNYVSTWDCKKNTLLIITYEAWKKMDAAKSALESQH